MTARDLESMLLDDDFVIDGRAYRKNGTVNLQTPLDTRNFFVRFLLLEAIAGVDYKEEEILQAYAIIDNLVNSKTEISSRELPYHPKKKPPSPEKKFIWDGNCCCSMQ